MTIGGVVSDKVCVCAEGLFFLFFNNHKKKLFFGTILCKMSVECFNIQQHTEHGAVKIWLFYEQNSNDLKLCNRHLPASCSAIIGALLHCTYIYYLLLCTPPNRSEVILGGVRSNFFANLYL